MAELVKAGLADTEQSCGSGSIEQTGVEICKDANDENLREPMDDLFLFKAGIMQRTGKSARERRSQMRSLRRTRWKAASTSASATRRPPPRRPSSGSMTN